MPHVKHDLLIRLMDIIIKIVLVIFLFLFLHCQININVRHALINTIKTHNPSFEDLYCSVLLPVFILSIFPFWWIQVYDMKPEKEIKVNDYRWYWRVSERMFTSPDHWQNATCPNLCVLSFWEFIISVFDITSWPE